MEATRVMVEEKVGSTRRMLDPFPGTAGKRTNLEKRLWNLNVALDSKCVHHGSINNWPLGSAGNADVLGCFLRSRP